MVANDSNVERRKAWIYDVPLATTHQLRSSINSVPSDMPIDPAIFDKYDPPVIASLVKLWLLELIPPVMLWDSWEDVKKLYPTVGADVDAGAEDHSQRLEEEMKSALMKVPLIGLKVLNTLVAHLKQ